MRGFLLVFYWFFMVFVARALPCTYPLLTCSEITVPLLQRVTFYKRLKGNPKRLPHHLAPRLGSVCPTTDLEPWAAATGHPWPNAANPASCRVAHGSRPAFGQRGLTGRPRSRSKARRPGNWPVCASVVRYLHHEFVVMGFHGTCRTGFSREGVTLAKFPSPEIVLSRLKPVLRGVRGSPTREQAKLIGF